MRCKPVSSSPNDDYLERVKAEIRADAETARVRVPLPRRDPPPRSAQPVHVHDGVDRAQLDYAIGELTATDYIAFIDHAFRALLKRGPDDAGSELQVRILAAGGSKAEVLGNLRYSPEGRRVGTRVRGLLPRYVLAKLARVRILGYFVEWGLAFAGLPLLLRHQRAADTSVAARFGELGDAQRRSAQSIAEGASSHTALSNEHDRRSEALREDIGRIVLRLDELESRARAFEQRNAENVNELVELRHHVHAANHWVVSVQRSLADLEDAAHAERSRADTVLAAITESADDATARSERHAAWTAILAPRLPAAAQVLDLGSGGGAWLQSLAARGIAATGIEANASLVARAQLARADVALGDPFAALRRCATAGLHGITLTRQVVGDNTTTATELLAECVRVLKPGGYLLLRFERDPSRFADLADAAAGVDLQAWAGLLVAAGFPICSSFAATGGAALLAQRAGS